MAAPVKQEVLIEFITDDSQLQSSVDRLEEMGAVEKKNADSFKASTTELQKQVKALGDVNAATQRISQGGQPIKKTLLDINNAVKGIGQSFLKDFQQGAKEALDQAGVSVEEFEKALEGVDDRTVSVKAQLREMVEALAQMKVSGQDNTEQYRQLAQQAGALKDAIGDANQEVSNFGSDTSTLDGVISLAGGVAGGFAAIQGAAALAGAENEDLQKVLLRVNASMALLQGLQQIYVVLQKESAAATLVNTLATRAQTFAQGALNFVIGTSTGLLKAFRIALAATGVGLLIIGIYELTKALQTSNEELEESNRLIEKEKQVIEGLNDAINQRVALEEAKARAVNASESEIIRIQGRGLLSQIDGLVESNKILAQQRDALENGTKAWFDLNQEIQKNTNTINGLNNQAAIKQIDFDKQVADERAEALKKRIEAEKKAREDAAKKAAELRAKGFNDFKAGIQLEILAAQEGSEEQLAARKRLLQAQLLIDLENENLTINERKLAIAQFLADRLQLEKDYNKNREKLQLDNVALDLNAELKGLEISNERKLELTEALINLQAEQEITAANGNAAKITEINANRDKAIRDARITSIQEAVNYEISLARSTNGPAVRALQADIANEKLRVSVRKASVDELVKIESSAIQKRISALNEEKKGGLISEKDYALQYSELVDEQLKIFEDAEKKKTDIQNNEIERRRQQTIDDITTTVEVAEQLVGVLDALYQSQATTENNDLDRRKQQLEDLKEAGAITEKEAIARQKRIDAEERIIRRRQAEREKQIATFNAFLAVPQAVLRGLTTGGPILAAIYGAIALSQAIIVAARPIPKFGKGKKDKYQGFGEVGETGPEIIQSKGKMWLADKRQTVWLGKDDKVFNPQETVAMLSKTGMSTERMITTKTGNTVIKIDYEKMGKAVGKHLKTDVYVDGYHSQHLEKHLFEQYLNARRG